MKRGKKWQARITWRDSDGKLHQKSKSGFDTKQQAKQYAAELETKRLSGMDIKSDPLLIDYYNRWFETYKKPNISDVTANHYTLVRNLIKKNFSNVNYSAINDRASGNTK